MKYILVIGDGMADNPVPALEDATPLEKANIPVMDTLAATSEIGCVRTVPKGIAPGSDTAILNILGYDPRRYFKGRSPLEAAGLGVVVNPGEVSFRCNMVSLSDDAAPYAQKQILSHSGGSVEGEEALTLMQALLQNTRFDACIKQNKLQFHINPSFRHIAVQTGTPNLHNFHTTPPHDHLGEVIAPLFPTGGGALAQNLCEIMQLAHEILNNHPVNQQRRANGKLPANGLWFWAQGEAIVLPNFSQQHDNKKGTIISAVPLTRGIGVLAGLDYIEVSGATGELDTNYEGKADAVLDALAQGYDFALLHVEAPDECTHNGDLKGKIQAIEWLDSRCIGRLTQKLAAAGTNYRMLVLSDHKTLTATRAHDGDPVPYILYDSTAQTAGSGLTFTEANCDKRNFIKEGCTLMAHLFEEPQPG